MTEKNSNTSEMKSIETQKDSDGASTSGQEVDAKCSTGAETGTNVPSAEEKKTMEEPIYEKPNNREFRDWLEAELQKLVKPEERIKVNPKLVPVEYEVESDAEDESGNPGGSSNEPLSKKPRTMHVEVSVEISGSNKSADKNPLPVQGVAAPQPPMEENPQPIAPTIYHCDICKNSFRNKDLFDFHFCDD